MATNWASSSHYMRDKVEKLRLESERQHRARARSGGASRIFENVRAQFSLGGGLGKGSSLSALIAKLNSHGGRMEQYDTRQITHVITDDLSTAKGADVAKKRAGGRRSVVVVAGHTPP